MSRLFGDGGDSLQNGSDAIVFPTPAGTVAFWFKPISYVVGDGGTYPARQFLHLAESGGGAGGFYIGLDAFGVANTLAGGWFSNSGSIAGMPHIATANSTFVAAFNPTGWNLITVTWNSSGQSLYLNNQLMATASGAPPTGTTNSFLYIGGGGGGTAPGGEIAQFAVWDLVLNSTLLTNLYNGCNPSLISGLSYYWPLVAGNLSDFGGAGKNLSTNGTTVGADDPTPAAYVALSFVSAIHGNAGTSSPQDDSATINTWLETISTSAGEYAGLYWDKYTAWMDTVVLPGNVPILPSPALPKHWKYYGALNSFGGATWTGGTDNHCLRTKNCRKGLPVRGSVSANANYSSLVNLPIGLAGSAGNGVSNSTGGTAWNNTNTGAGQTFTLGTGQAALLDPANLPTLLGSSDPYLITISDGTHTELCLLTAINLLTDTITVTRGGSYTVAGTTYTCTPFAWATAYNWTSHTGPFVIETMIDTNIQILGNFVGDCSGETYSNAYQNAASGHIVTAVQINSGGSSYSSSPTITASGGGANANQATFQATVVSGVITAVKVLDRGSGYTSPPTLTVTDGSGSGANLTVPNDPAHFPSFWSVGAWIQGAQNSNIVGLSLQDSATYGLFLSNLQDVNITNYSKQNVNWKTAVGSANDDGFHVHGPVANCLVNGISIQGRDNLLALNWAEQCYCAGYDRSGILNNALSGAGDLTNFQFYNVSLASPDTQVIYFPISLVGSPQTICNSVSFNGIVGSNMLLPFLCDIAALDFNSTDPGQAYSIVGNLSLANLQGNCFANTGSYGVIELYKTQVTTLMLANLDLTPPTTLPSGITQVAVVYAYDSTVENVIFSNYTWNPEWPFFDDAGGNTISNWVNAGQVGTIENAWSPTASGISTDPGEGNVLVGQDYTINGVAKTGTLTLPPGGSVYHTITVTGSPAGFFGVAGNGSHATASTYSEGQTAGAAAQLGSDQAAVAAFANQIQYGTTILGTAGELTLPNSGTSPYTPNSALVLNTGYYGPAGSLQQGTGAASTGSGVNVPAIYSVTVEGSGIYAGVTGTYVYGLVPGSFNVGYTANVESQQNSILWNGTAWVFYEGGILPDNLLGSNANLLGAWGSGPNTITVIPASVTGVSGSPHGS